MKVHIKKFCAIMLMMGLGPVVWASTAEESLKNVLNPITSIQGNFQQKMLNEQGQVLQENTGKVWVKKPGKFRWEVRGKDQRLVVTDGHKMWDYDSDLEQVVIQAASPEQRSAPIFFLTGDVEALSKDFSVNTLKASGANTPCMTKSDQCFELKPTSKQGMFQWIRIGFKAGKLRDLELLDELGQHSVFHFKDLVLNSEIPLQYFQFIPPEGVDVVSH